MFKKFLIGVKKVLEIVGKVIRIVSCVLTCYKEIRESFGRGRCSAYQGA